MIPGRPTTGRRAKYAKRRAQATPNELQRLELAKKRIRSVLGRHIIASHRTLEQKIADAGPSNQRINPHVLSNALYELKTAGELLERQEANGSWLYLSTAPVDLVQTRLTDQLALWNLTQDRLLTTRIGQVLEIAVYRAMLPQSSYKFLGAYLDLSAHDDKTLYSKEEPPGVLDGNSIGDRRFDFVLSHSAAGWAGVEVKNKREWMYPANKDIRELLSKAITVDAVPVLIARRVPFVTFRLLSPCGLIIHQTYNQLYPSSENEVAARLREKTLLGYHDIRVGNDPDPRLKKFIVTNLPQILPEARSRFEEYRDLLDSYARGNMPYEEFAARVRRRQQGVEEDHDPGEEEDDFDYD
jgi:hypothetical protein